MDLGAIVLATGALGTAAFGIVEGLKSSRLGEAGFSKLMQLLGDLTATLSVAYGPAYRELLRGQYRGDSKELTRVLRQGARVGLSAGNVEKVAKFLGAIDATALSAAVVANDTGQVLSDQQRNAIGRFELAADARIDSAVTVAQSHYTGATRLSAAIIALIIAFVVAAVDNQNFLLAGIIGLAAVPLAPIAKDVASGIQAATKALRDKV